MSNKMMEEHVKKSFDEINIPLTVQQINQFIRYFELLVEWNKKINLTAIIEPKEVLMKHFVDSVLSHKVLEYNKIESLIDIGTGAGFPGIPLKIVFPHLKVTLVDALNKRVNYLELVIEALELEEIVALHGRAEDLARTDLREGFDLCVSRAVSQLNVLCEYCLPFIKEGGYFVSYKGAKTMEELEASHNAIELLGGEVEDVTNSITLSKEIQRGFVKIKKITATPSKYPRRAGKPLKKPL